MLSLSRMISRSAPPAALLPTIGPGAPLADEPLTCRIVAALEQGGLAAAVFEPGTLVTLAANARFNRVALGNGSERALKTALRSRGIDPSPFIWLTEAGVRHIVRHFEISECGRSMLIVTISDPGEEEALRFADFVTRHRVTRAEARLLARLLAGESPGDIAAAFALSLPTIKSQLRSLLAKTGASRQAVLIALFYRDLASRT